MLGVWFVKWTIIIRLVQLSNVEKLHLFEDIIGVQIYALVLCVADSWMNYCHSKPLEPPSKLLLSWIVDKFLLFSPVPRHFSVCFIFRTLKGLTIVDSYDTLFLMGLNEEADKAKDWLLNDLKFDTVWCKFPCKCLWTCRWGIHRVIPSGWWTCK